MEIKLIDQALNLEQATQELRDYTHLSKEFQLAIKDKKIQHCDNEDLAQALRYAMLLVGIRAANLPSQMEFDVLKQFIRRTYHGHTPSEIRLAFDKAVAGELNLKTEEVKAFENFSCEYVGRIMRAYRVWASNQYEEQRQFKHEMQKAIEGPKLSDPEFVDFFYQDYLFGKLKIELLSEMVYDKAKVHFVIKFKEEELKNFVLRARESVLTDYVDRMKGTDSNRKLGAYLELKEAYSKLKAMDPLDSCNDSNVNRRAKAFALIHFFSEQKTSGVLTLNPKP